MVPPSPNDLRRKYRNRFAYRDLRLLWENHLYHAISGRERNELIDFALGHRMEFSMIQYRAKELDPDNLTGSLKPVLDALKNVGFIHDDKKQWIEIKSVRVELTGTRTNGGSVITLAPIHEKDVPRAA